MKTNTPVLIVLAALLAAPASAQVVGFNPAVNPVYGLPKSLPSPLSGPLTGMRISLPNLIGVTPTISLAAAPLAAPSALPSAAVVIALPAAPRPVAYVPEPLEKLPRVQAVADRENRANPFRSLLPDGVARFGAAAPAQSPADAKAEQDRLDQLFDGEGQPARRPTVELPRRAPVKPSRRHSLPEWDLESELGLSSH